MRINKRTVLSGRYDEIKIFALNDLHFRKGTDGNPNATGAIGGEGADTRYYYASPNNLRNFVEIANQEKPDMVMLLGDICDSPTDWDLFNEIWGGLDPTIKRVETIGNHDIGGKSYEELTTILGYENKPNLGGSKFNQTFALDKNTRIIIVDSTFNQSDQHGNHYQDVRIHTNSVTWIKNILETTYEDNVFIGTHVGIQLENISYFDKPQALQMKNIVDNVKVARTGLNVTWLFGHHHINFINKHTNLGDNNVGYLLPATINAENGFFTEIRVAENNFTVNKRDLLY